MKKSFSIKKALSNVGDVFAKSWRGNRKKEGPTWETKPDATEKIDQIKETLFCFWTRATHETMKDFADTAQAQQSFLVAQFEKAMMGIEPARRQAFQLAYSHFEMGYVELTKGALKEGLEEFRKSQKSANDATESAVGVHEKAEATRLLIATTFAIEAGNKDKVKEKIQHHLKKFYHSPAVHSAFWKKTTRSTIGRLINKLKNVEKIDAILHVAFAVWHATKKVAPFPLDRPRRKGRAVPFPTSWQDFWQAASDGDTETVLKAIDDGVPIDCANEARWTALTFCAEHGHIDTVKALLDKGASSNAHDRWGYTALLKACEKGQYGAAMELIVHGANPNSIPTNGMSPLMYACKDGQYKVAECLIDLRADIRSISQVGWTPIGMAERAGNHDIAELLRHHLAGNRARSPMQSGVRKMHSYMPHTTPARSWDHHDGDRDARYLVDDEVRGLGTMEVGPPTPKPGPGPQSDDAAGVSLLASLPNSERTSESESEAAGVGLGSRSRHSPVSVSSEDRIKGINNIMDSFPGSAGANKGPGPLLRSMMDAGNALGSQALPVQHAGSGSLRPDSAPGPVAMQVSSSGPRELSAPPPMSPEQRWAPPASLSLPNLSEGPGPPRTSFPGGKAAGSLAAANLKPEAPAPALAEHRPPPPAQARAPSFPTPQSHRWSPPRSPKPSLNSSFNNDDAPSHPDDDDRPPHLQASVTPPSFSSSPIFPRHAPPPLIPSGALHAPGLAGEHDVPGTRLSQPGARAVSVRPALEVHPRFPYDPSTVGAVLRASPPPPPKTNLGRFPSSQAHSPSPPTRSIDGILTPPPARTSPPYHLWALGGYLPTQESRLEFGKRWGAELLSQEQDDYVASADDGWTSRSSGAPGGRRAHELSPVKQWWKERERLSIADGRVLGTHTHTGTFERFPLRQPYRPAAKGEAAANGGLGYAQRGGAHVSEQQEAARRLGQEAGGLREDPWDMLRARRIAKHRDWAQRAGIQDMSASDDIQDLESSIWSNDPIWVSRGVV